MLHLSAETKEWQDWATLAVLDLELSDEIKCEAFHSQPCSRECSQVAVAICTFDCGFIGVYPICAKAVAAIPLAEGYCAHCLKPARDCWGSRPIATS